MPEMGFLITSHYNVVLFFLSGLQSQTSLPLRTPPYPTVVRRFILIGFVYTNHFIELYLRNGHSVPPLTISGMSTDYQVLKVETVHTRVECICIMRCSVVLIVLDAQSILIKH